MTPGTVEFDAADGMLVPNTDFAVAVHVYRSPLVRPSMIIGLPVPDAAPLAPPFDDTHETP